MPGKFISQDECLRLAREEIRSSGILGDRLFAPWVESTLGEPVLVRTVFGEPSYWTVPVLLKEAAVGFIRVLGTGRIAALGAFYQDPAEISACPRTVTGIDAARAARKARDRIHLDSGESASEPIYVHDGPQGREAWRIQVLREGRPVRWVFVTPAFVYERAAGEVLDEDLE
jgi:hypothetical protein